MPSGVASTGSSIALSALGPTDPTVQADWEGLTWVEWEEATNIGDIGPTGDEQTYIPVKTGDVVKVATSVDNGQVDAEGPYVKTDPAITLLRTATDARPIAPVWCRITDSDGEVEYFKGNPNAAKKKIGGAQKHPNDCGTDFCVWCNLSRLNLAPRVAA